ncbi:MAG: hypothetical protein Kow0096_18450 [Thiohalomonadaceae bacterium]
MYHKTRRYRAQLAAARAAKERKRLEGEAPTYPTELPRLRRRIVIIDYDHGRVVHRFDLYRSDRVDCYNVSVNGGAPHKRAGWSRIVAEIRKVFPRVASPRGL